MTRQDFGKLSRRELFKLGGAALIGSVALRAMPAFGRQLGGCAIHPSPIEVFPTSPLIGGYIDSAGRVLGAAFTDPLPIPKPLAPVPPSVVSTWSSPPGNGLGQQDSKGGTHQIWPSQLGLPEPVIYQIRLDVSTHSFSSLPALAIDSSGQPTVSWDDKNYAYPAGTPRQLPGSCIYGFNGTFPGPMIYARYGQPCLVRFENHLDENDYVDRCDFGAEDYAFLTHLHNGHTAPESDGNPHHMPSAYRPGEWVDNMYLNYPAGGDDREKQSFFWFHDHRMDHTGANVYKGMVGLYPIYDSKQDAGNERTGLRLPGVPNAATGRTDYDIPLAFYDCCLDDGVTQHQDFHNGCGEAHPEWWGKTFFRHFPNHGFVGDVFTVNGVAYPVLEVKRRKYRLRFLDASIARCYEFKLMQGTVAAVPGQQGQYNFGHYDSTGNFVRSLGEQCMRFTQIASEGGLLPAPIVRDSFQIWPAKRREVVVDFSRYMDGTPTTKGDVVYLTNILKMATGRKPNNEPKELNDDGVLVDDPEFDPNYAVPVLKIVIGDNARDDSLVPKQLRALPPMPRSFKGVTARTFELQRSGKYGGEIEWLINDLPFEPSTSLAFPLRGSGELWTIRNGGGGWVHPLHLHMEEHRVISRNGVPTPAPGHPDDNSKEDVVALGPGEEVVIYRQFRTFAGKYVSHCHNLAHEDHAMMFGWEILP